MLTYEQPNITMQQFILPSIWIFPAVLWSYAFVPNLLLLKKKKKGFTSDIRVFLIPCVVLRVNQLFPLNDQKLNTLVTFIIKLIMYFASLLKLTVERESGNTLLLLCFHKMHINTKRSRMGLALSTYFHMTFPGKPRHQGRSNAGRQTADWRRNTARRRGPRRPFPKTFTGQKS